MGAGLFIAPECAPLLVHGLRGERDVREQREDIRGGAWAGHETRVFWGTRRCPSWKTKKNVTKASLSHSL